MRGEKERNAKMLRKMDVTMSMQFQDKALERTGNYKYSPFQPKKKKTMLKSDCIISDSD